MKRLLIALLTFIFSLVNVGDVIAYTVELDTLKPSYYGQEAKDSVLYVDSLDTVSLNRVILKARPLSAGNKSGDNIITALSLTQVSFTNDVTLKASGSRFKSKKHSMCRYLIQRRA